MAYQPKSYRKFLAGSVSAALVATAVGPVVANAASFSDVNPNDSHAANINALVELGYIKGFADGTFKPYQSITRGQVAKIFARILTDQGFQAPDKIEQVFDDVPLDAKDQELVKAAAIVKAAGVMTGSQGKLNPAQNITREQMAKVLVEAFDLTKPADFTSKITDLDKADPSFRDYIQTLEANGVTVVTEYRPKDSVTRAAFASFVKRALDVSSVVTADDITAVKFVDENTLEVTFNGELKEVKKDDFAIEGVEIDSVSIKAAASAESKTTVVVIKTKTKLEEGKTYTISYKGKTTDKAKVEVPVVTPKVESVSAINLNQILVTFNKELDKESAENLANYTLNNGTVNAALNNNAAWTEAPKATLQADGKSVLITLDTNANSTYQTLANQIEAKLTIDGVKTKDGKAIDKSEYKFSYTDATVPTVESVSMEGNKVIVVKFSEAVKAAQAVNVNNYQIDGVSLSAYGVGTPQWDAEKNEVRIPLTTALPDKTYKLKVSVNNGIEDVAGFKLMQVEKDLTVTTDTTVGKLTEVSVADDKSYVLVKFSKALAPSNFVKGQPLFIDGIDVFRSGATVAATVENGALKLTPTGSGADFNAIIANGIHAVNLKNDDNNYLVDAYGIKVAAGTASYTVVADTTKPTVESVKVNEGATTIEVKFSESVDSATAQNRFNYTLKKADGSVVTISNAAFKSGSTNTVVLTVNALDAGNYTLTVQNVKDRAGNTMDSYSTSLSVADLVAPTVTAVKQGTGSNSNSIYVYFSEPVNTATATDVNNYLYNNKALPAGTTITALSASAVKITLPSSTTVTQGTPFAVSNNVTDLAGNKIVGYGYQTTVSGIVANDLDLPATGTNVTVIDKRTVKVTLNKELKNVVASDFQFHNGTNWTTLTVPQQNVSYVNKDGKAEITFKFDSDVVDEAGYVTGTTPLKVRLNQTGSYGTVAVDDTTFADTALGGVNGTAAADKIAPTLASTDGIVTVDSDADGKIDGIKLTFTEPIDGNYLAATTFDVSGYTVKAAGLDTNDPSYNGTTKTGKVVLITVDEKSTPDTDATPNVTRVGTVKDANGNEFTGLTTATASVDKAGPAIVAAKITTAGTNDGWGNDVNDVLQLTFSENVVSKFTDVDTATQGIQISAAELNELLGTNLAYDTTNGTVVTAAVSGNTVTLTVTGAAFASSGKVSAGDTIDPVDGADVIEDAVGNVINDAATVDVE
ncbi:S-layer homology domain-containing protein [Parageobacillus thermoglucosidasius]|uniref:S-layer homology domain-containing protein n=1 Tax=Parageobacillus thermoglucosidasius TaxID=1426 RepID=UPI003B673852